MNDINQMKSKATQYTTTSPNQDLYSQPSVPQPPVCPPGYTATPISPNVQTPPGYSGAPITPNMQNPPAGPYLPLNPPMPMYQEGPPTLQSDYIPGFLASIIGRNVKAEFIVGTSQYVEKTGKLVDVGVNYFVLQDINSRTNIMCDLYSVRFVTILY